MKTGVEQIKIFIDDCVSVSRCSNHPFSKWDLDFIASVEEQFREKGFLTTKQKEVLKDIWDKI